MATYNLDEILYPDFATKPSLPGDISTPYTVYNLNTSDQVDPHNPDFYLCNCYYYQCAARNSKLKFYLFFICTDEPANNPGQVGKTYTINLEDILKKEPQVWKAYTSGRFDVKQYFEI